MPITCNSLLVGGATGWHNGTGTLTWSILGAEVPGYYPTLDTNGDGTPDVYDLSNGGGDPKYYVGINDPLTAVDAGLAALAVQAWNDVANINMVPGTIGGGGGDGNARHGYGPVDRRSGRHGGLR